MTNTVFTKPLHIIQRTAINNVVVVCGSFPNIPASIHSDPLLYAHFSILKVQICILDSKIYVINIKFKNI